MKHNRRDFLVKSSCALSMVALATQARHFGMMSALAQEMDDAKFDGGTDAPTDYRALVCIFLDGGNDSNNMIVPKHNDANISNYSAYTSARQVQGLALTQAQLLSMNVPRLSNLEYGLHWNMGPMANRADIPNGAGVLGPSGTFPGGYRNAGIHDRFAAGDLAIIANVGTLVRPMTRAQYQNGSIPRPYQLYSHSDQQNQMVTAISNNRSYTGWGGRTADALFAWLNPPPPPPPAPNPNPLVPMITSIAGSQLFTSGMSTRALTIADAGTALNNVLVLGGYGTDAISIARRNALNGIRAIDIQVGSASPDMVKAASFVTEAAVTASNALSTQNEVTDVFPNTDIGRQLKQVARMIKKRDDLRIKRQIFFVRIGGYDTHNNQVSTVTSGQNSLLLRLSQAMRAFYDEMGTLGLQNNVTQFTLSDFGRTFDPADTGAVVGSDHAWGSHMLVLGGAVNGGNFYGSLRPDGTGNVYPTLVKGGPDDTDGGSAPRGRWIPTTSVEQYASVLAKWYGLIDPAQIATVFPNLGNFAASTSYLDFLQPQPPMP